MLLEFIESNKIILCATPVITEEDQIIRYVKCAFHFTSELWLNMVAIRAVFKSASYGDSEEVILDSSNCCYMPIDVYKHGGVIQVALYGDYLANNGTRAVTSYIGPVNVFFGKNPRLPVPIPSRYDVFVAEYFRILSENSAVLDEMQQLIEDFSDISDIRFTEDLHLVITMRNGDVYVSPVSLKGDKGDKGDRGNPGASGLQGEPGPSGADGKSAYEAAVSGGYSGTEAEFEARLASAIPSKTSDLVNDSGFLTEAPVTSVNGQTGVVTIAVPTKTSDLTNDSGFISSETDPTVPSWAKASSKPSYNFSEIGSKPNSISGYGITDAYTKTQIDGLVSGVLHYKGTKASTSALPSSGNTTGDTWHITADGSEWAWDGSAWQELGTAVDLSSYALKSEIPTVPSNVGAFTNDVGYLTLADLPVYNGGVS